MVPATHPEADSFFASAERWADEMTELRELVAASGLVEEWKWKQPCYTHAGTNVVIISPFANHCALSFFQGVLLDDPAELLTTPGKNSQSARQLRITSVDEVRELADAIEGFLAGAIANVDHGRTVDFSAKDELTLPDELVELFDEVDGLESAFAALTPGRQRGFVLHIEGAKQSSTRRSRSEKHVARILAGKGIQDCICGKSGRMPRCDGSHAR